MTKVGKVFRDKVVTTIKNGVEKQQTTLVINYDKLPTGNLSSLRKTLRSKKAKMYSSRNSLVQVALKGTEYASLAENLVGQTALVWTNADAADVAKLLVKFAEKNETFIIQGGVFDKSLLKKQDVKRLADLPAKEVILSKILGALQSPATALARNLNSKQTDLILILKQLSEKKGGN
jgi:large subunit ribosomal protein L10